jgi:enamine deaminase RidA (YjgF/YER057c/UK114 family)
MNMTPEQNLANLGLELKAPNAPAANYVQIVRSGTTLYISGQLPMGPDGLVTGTVGKDLDIEAGKKAAELCALAILSQAVHAGGVPLSQIRVLKLTAFVACEADFTSQPMVVNGASDVLVKILGDNGRHARVAVGAISLPLGAAVEIDAILDVIP